MKNIVVTNIYGGKNIGDMAIRNEGLSIIHKAYGNQNYTLLCEEQNNFPLEIPRNFSYSLQYAPYGYAIRSRGKTISLSLKFIRFILIYISSIYYSLLGLISINFLPKQGFYNYIRNLRQADIVIGMGGGYFITSHPLKDYFGIGLNVLPFYIAKMYGKKIIILPSSFGPFASNIQETFVGHAIKNSYFMAREEISLKMVRKFTPDAYFYPDLALYSKKNYKKTLSDFYVLTFREGLTINHTQQHDLEVMLADFINELWQKYKFKCVYIPMASNPIEENDLNTANRIVKLINNNKAFEIKKLKNPNQVKVVLSKARFAICNRLHSAILATTVNTPFISISYAHKTNGFMKTFGLSNWNINMNELNASLLREKYSALMKEKNYKLFKISINKKYPEILNHRSSMINSIQHYMI